MNRIMKKAAAAVLSLAMITSSSAALTGGAIFDIPVLTASAAQSGYLHYTVSNGKVTIIDIDDFIQDVVIPKKINGMPVVAIDPMALSWNAYIKNVFIEAEIETLMANCFNDIPNLEKVVLPPTLRKIGDYAFQQCIRLKHIVIPYRVNYIGACAFYNCRALKDVVFRRPDCNYIADTAFLSCTSLTGIYTPNYGSVSDWAGNHGHSAHVKRYTLGNVNSDYTVSAADANAVLAAALALNMNDPSGLTHNQEIAADIDGDWKITALDAQYIAEYVNSPVHYGMEAWTVMRMLGLE